jgi:hypothetical protein
VFSAGSTEHPASGSPRAAQPPPLPKRPTGPKRSDSTDAPVADVAEPQHYRRPFDRRLLIAGVCFAAVGVLPMLAYYAPPVEREEFSRRDDQHTTLEVSRGPRTSEFPSANEVPIASVAEPVAPIGAPSEPEMPAPSGAVQAPPQPGRWVDDPQTPVDESDPLIAAALSAIREESTTVAVHSRADESPSSAGVAASARVAAPAPQLAAPGVRLPTTGPSPGAVVEARRLAPVSKAVEAPVAPAPSPSVPRPSPVAAPERAPQVPRPAQVPPVASPAPMLRPSPGAGAKGTDGRVVSGSPKELTPPAHAGDMSLF